MALPLNPDFHSHLDYRKMLLEDTAVIAEIERLTFPDPWPQKAFEDELKNEHAIYHVVTFNEQVIGYAGVWKILDEGHITNIAIHPDFRQHGIGRKLVTDMLESGPKEGIEQFTLEVRASNQVAILMYEQLGFVSAGKRPNYYDHPKEDAIIMWRTLSQ